MATRATVEPKIKGGSFLIEERRPEEIFTPEDVTEEHRQIAQTTDEFFANEVLPRRLYQGAVDGQYRYFSHNLAVALDGWRATFVLSRTRPRRRLRSHF